MSYSSKLSPAQQLEQRQLSQPYYHDNSICGSTFHGLAYTIQEYIQNHQFEEAIHQVTVCITAREDEERRRGSFSTKTESSHQRAIRILKDFRSEIQKVYNNVRNDYYYYNAIIPHIIVRFDDNLFRFYILHKSVDITKKRGGIIYKQSYKNKKRKIVKQTIKRDKQTKKNKSRKTA